MLWLAREGILDTYVSHKQDTQSDLILISLEVQVLLQTL
jgi:hypothetical protein